MEKQLIECIPNFSEGRDQTVIAAIANAIKSVREVKLLDVDSGVNANRTVYTFIGEPSMVCEAAFQAAKTAQFLIDMTTQLGEHPRVGSLDVCPLVPISNISMAETIAYSQLLASRISSELNIPTYLYESSANTIERKNLAWIRKGEYESLPLKMLDAAFKPDFGEAIFNARSGISVVGARPFLIAFNINLNTKDIRIAQKIAGLIRESGIGAKPGILKYVKAIGWYIKEFDKVQISMNLTDYNQTPIWRVFEEIQKLALHFETKITGSELVGMIPKKALLETGLHFRKEHALTSSEIELIEYAIDYLGLREVKPFDIHCKVIEYAMEQI